MDTGKLTIQVVAAEGAILIANATVILTDENGNVLYELTTDNSGHAPEVTLDAPSVSLMGDPYAERRYFVYNAEVHADGYRSVIYKNIMIFGQSDAIQVIHMHPLVIGEKAQDVEVLDVGGHALDYPIAPPAPEAEVAMSVPMPRILPEVIIPNTITVHLGEWNVWAPNVRVPFIDYIKNVVAHEIHHWWPEQTIIANLWCIISLTLNRVFTEFYRKRGINIGRELNFDITNTTQMDQKFVYRGATEARLNAVVDRIFNQYLAVVGHKEPFLALYNDGIVSNIPGRLSQWGSYFDARDRNMTAWQIIRKYYAAHNLELRETDNFSGPLESWPGASLSMGSTGVHVETMQRYLNRILGRWTNIIINPVDGIFGPSTRTSVITFQREHNLPQTGIIDRVTWYQISRIYAIEKGLWEMHSEGIRIGIGTTPPTTIIREGSQGRLVTELQFLLEFIAMHHNEIPFTAQTSRFDRLTLNAVREFQRIFGLNVDGVVGPLTWRRLYEVYWGIVNNTPPPQPAPPPANPPGMPTYPGSPLRIGASGENVRRIQQAINRLARAFPPLWEIPENGVFDENMQNAIFTFQRLFGLTIDGVVGPITWDRLFREYLNLQPGGVTPPQPPTPPPPTPPPPFPGWLIRRGATGDLVRQIQTCLNNVMGAGLNTDGIFGPITEAAVMNFQRSRGLNPDGIVGPLTWNALMQACHGGATPTPPPTPPPPFPGWLIRRGATGDLVRQIQTCLNNVMGAGLNTDGIFGPITEAAVMNFQRSRGLNPDGIVGPLTWGRLMPECYSGTRAISRNIAESGAENVNVEVCPCDCDSVLPILALLLASKILSSKR